MRRALSAAIAMVVAALGASAASAKVLRVGTFKGIPGTFTSIQAAVNNAKPGDWILVGPGDYKEHSGQAPKGRSDLASGVLMSTPRVYLRGHEPQHGDRRRDQARIEGVQRQALRPGLRSRVGERA